MSASYLELYIDQGADFDITVTIQDENNNQFQNLDNTIITSYLRRSLLSQNTSGQFDCHITDEANGELVISMASADTANLHIGTHMFDVKINNNGIISRLLEGIVIVTPSITT
jgi:hypothetical protein